MLMQVFNQPLTGGYADIGLTDEELCTEQLHI